MLIAAMLGLTGCGATRGGYETAPYRVVRAEGPFELREYPALRVAETPMAGADESGNGGFRRLFRYISGGNDGGRKIAMTTPVWISEAGADSTMAFVLPSEMAGSAIPQPSDSAVRVRELPPGRFAATRFRGGRADGEGPALERLKAWMARQGWTAEGSPVYAYFDPPWTPGFLRRNEVMLRVVSTDGEATEPAGP